jgi:hypothetical protein
MMKEPPEYLDAPVTWLLVSGQYSDFHIHAAFPDGDTARSVLKGILSHSYDSEFAFGYSFDGLRLMWVPRRDGLPNIQDRLWMDCVVVGDDDFGIRIEREREWVERNFAWPGDPDLEPLTPVYAHARQAKIVQKQRYPDVVIPKNATKEEVAAALADNVQRVREIHISVHGGDQERVRKTYSELKARAIAEFDIFCAQVPLIIGDDDEE